jgi:hypothetical protein
VWVEVKWNNLSRRLTTGSVGEVGTLVSRHIVSGLLKKQGYRRRKALKKNTIWPSRADRKSQFENIARHRATYSEASLPVSINTEKEGTGKRIRQDGVIDTQKVIAVSGHDFGSMGLCTVISHRIYSLKYNGGFVHLNTSREASELACDSIEAR